MNIFVKLTTKIDLIKILCSHLKSKWRINNIFIMIFLSIISFIFFIPIISDTISSYTYSPSNYNTIKTSIIYLLCTLLIVIELAYFRNRKLLETVQEEIEYGFNTLSFVNNIYNSIISSYIKFRSNFKFVINPVRDHSKYDDIIANIILLKIFTLYFDHINNKNGKISSNVILSLFNNPDYNMNEFYSKAFFDIDDNNEKNKLKILIIDSVMQIILTKSWFKNYYDPLKINMITEFIIKQWYENFINYTLKK